MDVMMALMTKISEKLDDKPGGRAHGDDNDSVLNFYGNVVSQSRCFLFSFSARSRPEASDLCEARVRACVRVHVRLSKSCTQAPTGLHRRNA